MGVTGQIPQYGNTATTDDHPCCALASLCWFEGGEMPLGAGSSSQPSLSSHGSVGSQPGGMRVQCRGERSAVLEPRQGAQLKAAALVGEGFPTAAHSPPRHPPAPPPAQPTLRVLTQHPACPGRASARGCLGRASGHRAQGCLAREGMGVSEQDESIAIQVLRVFAGTRSRAQAARPGEVH